MMPCKNPGNQRVVEIDNRRQRVKRSLGQSAFRTGAGGRRRFAGHAANKLHEQLRQFEIMNGVEHRQRTNGGLGRVIAAPGQDGRYRIVNG